MMQLTKTHNPNLSSFKHKQNFMRMRDQSILSHVMTCLYNSIIIDPFEFGPSPVLLSLTAIQSLCDFLETSFHRIRCRLCPEKLCLTFATLIIKRIRDEFLKNGNKTYMIEKCVRNMIRRLWWFMNFQFVSVIKCFWCKIVTRFWLMSRKCFSQSRKCSPWSRPVLKSPYKWSR